MQWRLNNEINNEKNIIRVIDINNRENFNILNDKIVNKNNICNDKNKNKIINLIFSI